MARISGTRPALAAGAVAALLLSGCGGGSSSSTRHRGSPAAGRQPTELTADNRPPVRGCDAAAFGSLGRGWRSAPSTVRIGSVVFPFVRGYRNDPRRHFAAHHTSHGPRYPGQKVLLVVDRGATVTVIIPSSERTRVSLLYTATSGEQPTYRVNQGTKSMRFEACPDQPTQFNGGFVVAGPRCVAVDVRDEKRARTVRGWIPFGTHGRPCPA